MPEPKLRLAIAALHEGDTAEALDWLSKLLETTLGKYEAQTPDPVEWAWFLISLLCSGKVADASKFGDYFPELTHDELQRARWAVCAAAGRMKDATAIATRSSAGPNNRHGRKSVHRLPQLTLDAYVQKISHVLKTCGQARLARKVVAVAAIGPTNGNLLHPTPSPVFVSTSKEDVKQLLEYLQSIRSGRRPTLKAKLKGTAPGIASAVTNALSRHPALKSKVRTFALNYLKIQDW
jgi:hypothetical protein